MFFILFLLFTAVPVLELYLLFKAGSTIGAVNTFIIVLLTGVVGASLARSQGLSLMNEIQGKMNRGELPADSLVHGFLVLAGGLLLLTPGFMTDFLGFSMVLPLTRFFYVQMVKVWLARKIQSGNVKFYSTGFSSSSASYEPPEGQSREFKNAKVLNVKDVTEDSDH